MAAGAANALIFVIKGISDYVSSLKNSYTIVNNQSGKDVVVSLSYNFLGTSQFRNRTLKARGGQDGDEYSAAGKELFSLNVVITAQISGSDKVQTAKVPIDRPIVFQDQAGGTGVDLFLTKPPATEGPNKDKVVVDRKLLTLA